jgi:hypothetical protein
MIIVNNTDLLSIVRWDDALAMALDDSVPRARRRADGEEIRSN